MADHPKPMHEGHAIQEVRMAIEYSKPGSPAVLEKAAEIYHSDEKMRKLLPRKQPGPKATLSIGITDDGESEPQVVQRQRGASSLLTFDRLMPDGTPAWRVTVAANHLAVVCTEYTRWGDVWKNGRHMLRTFIDAYKDQTTISAFGLMYVDRFIWEGAPDTFRADHLFRRDSSQLPLRAFLLKDLWHVHEGSIESFDDPSDHKRLTIVNIDVIDETKPGESSARVIRIVTTIRNMLSEPVNVTNELFVDGNSGLCDRHMDALHDACKQSLGDLLLEEVSGRISLWAKDPTHAQ